jgi:hypothetical protein
VAHLVPPPVWEAANNVASSNGTTIGVASVDRRDGLGREFLDQHRPRISGVEGRRLPRG